jgi:AraC-like DNA-binding protein
MCKIDLDIAYPVHPIIKQYVDYYYILNPKRKYLSNSYTAYPNINQPVIFFDNTEVLVEENHHYLKFNENAEFYCGVLNRFTNPLQVTITGNIKTINIIFRSTGLNSFIKAPYIHIMKNVFQKFNFLNTDESFISDLFCLSPQQLVKNLDEMLFNNYQPFVNEHLFNAINLMSCGGDNYYGINEIEDCLKISRKNLYRLFKTHTGISPTSFRRIIRFRELLEKIKSQDLSLTQLAYNASFCDQSHFNKELQKLTGDKPSSFLKDAAYLNGSKLLIKQ